MARQSTRVLSQLSGVHLAEGGADHGRDDQAALTESTVLEMVLQEGRNREIAALAGVGHKVMRLVRIATGPIRRAIWRANTALKQRPGQAGPLGWRRKQ